MKKIILLLVVICLWAPLSVLGHSSLSSSTPAEGERVEQPLEEIRLEFGGGIEQGSTMSIKNEEESLEFEDIAVSEQEMVGTLSEALPNGTYTVTWEIISADGHPLSGEILFEVEQESVEEPVAEERVEDQATEEEEEAVSDPQPGEEQEAAIPEAADASEESGTNWLVTLLIGAAVILLLISLYGLFVKKR
ncbi:copper resistance CopC family protein [Planococcus salinus]|uniref:Copper resistance protein CopC n=1 Tax=Planococcus salinus TaxID=1848460 RepID=A0A3M8P8S1_9BACL|nr:copper resistance CopC family protein [Planococcus salinus]RNF40106.1 copper resistance protein CopC [Planococcus salinus]